jgi:murein DD-endopeptidase MepM/ murein hydrolase activator NlpD
VHHGSDFPNPFGTPVFASATGRVVVAGDDQRVIHGERVGFYGQLVIIQLKEKYRGEKVYVLYGHLSKVHVRFLQEINEGDLIGEVGMTGVAIGPHLHLEVRVGQNRYSNTRNPELWLRPLPGSGTLAGAVVDQRGQLVSAQNLTVYRAESPDQRWRDLVSYSPGEINSDDEWQENFVLADVPAGSYVIKTYLSGKLLAREFTISDGEVASLTIEATQTESS